MTTALMRVGMSGRIMDPYKEVNHLVVSPPFHSKEIFLDKSEQNIGRQSAVTGCICKEGINFFIIKPNRCTNFTNLFWHETLHVSDSFSVHYQEFIHCTLINGIFHTGL